MKRRVLAFAGILIMLVALFMVPNMSLQYKDMAADGRELISQVRYQINYVPMLAIGAALAASLYMTEAWKKQTSLFSLLPAIAFGWIWLLFSKTPILWDPWGEASWWRMPGLALILLSYFMIECARLLVTRSFDKTFSPRIAIGALGMLALACLPVMTNGLTELGLHKPLAELPGGVTLIKIIWPLIYAASGLTLLPFVKRGSSRGIGIAVACVGGIGLAVYFVMQFPQVFSLDFVSRIQMQVYKISAQTSTSGLVQKSSDMVFDLYRVMSHPMSVSAFAGLLMAGLRMSGRIKIDNQGKVR